MTSKQRIKITPTIQKQANPCAPLEFLLTATFDLPFALDNLALLLLQVCRKKCSPDLVRIPKDNRSDDGDELEQKGDESERRVRSSVVPHKFLLLSSIKLLELDEEEEDIYGCQ
jgi:hypothetical protein